jgi:D-beta-D-heptose 7-phosphate kinase/D-beta-D-heptose 1-phosphate adenosyltransferase
MKVWVNGSFDVIHIGHIKLLEYANTLGNVKVGIDTDERIKKFKGKNRPFNSLTDRVKFLHSIKYINSVDVFDTDEQLVDLIKQYQPDYMVIGSDYKNKPIIGLEYIKEIIYFDRIKNKSTTEILNYGKKISTNIK